MNNSNIVFAPVLFYDYGLNFIYFPINCNFFHVLKGKEGYQGYQWGYEWVTKWMRMNYKGGNSKNLLIMI